MDDDSPFIALLGYAYLALVMVGSYVVARQVDPEWFCFVWLTTIVVVFTLSMGVFTVVIRWYR